MGHTLGTYDMKKKREVRVTSYRCKMIKVAGYSTRIRALTFSVRLAATGHATNVVALDANQSICLQIQDSDVWANMQ